MMVVMMLAVLRCLLRYLLGICRGMHWRDYDTYRAVERLDFLEKLL